MTTSPLARVYPYANDFVEPPRVEVLFDWNDEFPWPPWPPSAAGLPFPLEFRVELVSSATPPVDPEPGGPGYVFGFTATASDLLDVNSVQTATPFVEDVLRHLKRWMAGAGTFRYAGYNSTGRHQVVTGPNLHYDYVQFKEGMERAGDRVSPDAFVKIMSLQAVRYIAVLRDWHKAAQQPDRRRSGSAEDAPGSVRELRRLCRDEPTLGYVFRVLHYVRPDSAAVAEMKRLCGQVAPPVWLLAWPLDGGKPRKGYAAVPTLMTRSTTPATQRFLTSLAASDPKSPGDVAQFFAEDVSVRQIRPEGAAHGGPRAVADRFRRAGETASLTSLVSREDLIEAAAHVLDKPKNAGPPGPTDPAADAAVQQLVDAVLSLEEARPPFDVIAISWDRRADQLTKELNNAPGADKKNSDAQGWQSGFKGHLIDVKIGGESWKSLMRVRRRAIAPDGRRALNCDDARGWPDKVREGHVLTPVQANPTNDMRDSRVTIPRDFVVWTGWSLLLEHPLDKLAATDDPTHKLAGKAGDDGVDPRDRGAMAVEEQPIDIPQLRYGQDVEFRVRHRGLSNLAPSVTEPTPSSAKKFDPWGGGPGLRFLRTVPMSAPAYVLRPKRLREVEPPPVESDAQREPRTEFEIVGLDPEIEVDLRWPLAHWRVAAHARGIDADDETARLAFEQACFRFARRFRDAVGTRDRATVYLSALDPHTAGLRFESLVWYPFSDGTALHGDRFAVTGANERHYKAADSSCRELVIKGEDLIQENKYPATVEANVAPYMGLRRLPDPQSQPILHQGFRNRLSAYGLWDPEARRAQVDADAGFKRWTTDVVVYARKASEAIGGTVTALHETAAGPFHRVSLRYSGLKTLDLERRLAPPPAPNTAPQSPDQPPVRAAVLQWRRHFVYGPKSATDPIKVWVSYKAFLQRMLGATAESAKDLTELRLRLNPEIGGSVVVPGFAMPAPVDVQEIGDDTSAWYGVNVGKYRADPGKEGRVPFVDDDIVWIVRLNWRIALESTHIARPRDVAGVKEFRIFRTGQGEQPNLDGKPLGVIARPSDALLSLHHLDKVEWAFVDAIQGRDAHRFDYHVVAIPDYPHAFTPQTWYRFRVSIPASMFEPKPAHVVPLPMAGVAGESNVAVFFPRDERSRDRRLAYRLSALRHDPLLPPTGGTPPTVTPIVLVSPDLDEVFAGGPVEVPVVVPSVDSMTNPYQYDNEGWRWATAADFDKTPCPVDGRASAEWPAWRCDLSVKAAEGAVVRRRGFFKLQLVFYNPQGFPALAHTTPSDVLQTDWLQGYPNDLPAAEVTADMVRLLEAWVVNTPDALLRYRFHVFAARSATAPIAPVHVSSLYSDRPEIAKAALRTSVEPALGMLGLPPVDHAALWVVGEEGWLARTYAVDEGTGTANDDPVHTFVVLRSTRQPTALRLI
jgi:hypothetical protein